MLRFGPSGNSQSFYQQGYKHTYQAGEFLSKLGLNAYEYSFGRGISLKEETALKICKGFADFGITVSAHAPYYINFCNDTEEALQASCDYVLRSAKMLRLLGGQRLVVHVGTRKKGGNEDIVTAAKGLMVAEQLLHEHGLGDIILCLETMGKYSYFGTIDEIFELCCLSENFFPCLDFGHVNCIMQGQLKHADQYREIFDKAVAKIGKKKAFETHIHFSKISFGEKGELKHLDFSDTVYGPEFAPLAEVINEYGLTPTIICESREWMAEDAKKMMEEVQFASKLQ